MAVFGMIIVLHMLLNCNC